MSWAGALRGSDDGEPAKEHDGGLSFCERKGVLWNLLRKMRGEMTNMVREFCSGACMCIFWLCPKENLLALASDGFLQNLALEPLRAIREIGRRTGDVGANYVWGICSTIIAKKE